MIKRYKKQQSEGWFTAFDEKENQIQFSEKHQPEMYQEMIDSGLEIEPFEIQDEIDARLAAEFEASKPAKSIELKVACEEELKKGLLVLVGSTSFPVGFKIDCTRNDATFLSAVYNEMVLNSKTEIVFRDYDNTSRLITMSEFLTLLGELSTHISTQLAKKWSLQDSISGCATIAEVNAIIW